MYAAGKDNTGNNFKRWDSLPSLNSNEENLFSSTERMRDFFDYSWDNNVISLSQPVIFIANYKALQQESIFEELKGKTIWASGAKTWLELAKLGFWVQGSADALGFEWLLSSLNMPLLNIRPDDICILTHKEAAKRWNQKGFHAVSNYELIPAFNKELNETIALADYIFWSSYSQYKYYGQFVKETAIHVCAGGETATLLKKDGIDPVIFPTIKSFEQWRKTFSRPLSVA